MGMTTSTKKLFKKYEGFYRKGALRSDFVAKVREQALRIEENPDEVVKSWEDWCQETHGIIGQPDLVR